MRKEDDYIGVGGGLRLLIFMHGYLLPLIPRVNS